MIDIQTTMTLIVGVILVVWVITQQKFKGKMLCYFIRPNRVRIKKFVPLTNKHVRFEKSKYVPAGLYRCDPNCITMEWFSGGLNKIFPVFIPTLEFKWDTPNPLDPKTFESTWHTPEARDAAWEEHQHVAFAKAAASQAGKASRFPSWFLPLVIIGLCLVVIYVVVTGIAGLDIRMFNMEQQIKLK